MSGEQFRDWAKAALWDEKYKVRRFGDLCQSGDSRGPPELKRAGAGWTRVSGKMFFWGWVSIGKAAWVNMQLSIFGVAGDGCGKEGVGLFFQQRAKLRTGLLGGTVIMDCLKERGR